MDRRRLLALPALIALAACGGLGAGQVEAPPGSYVIRPRDAERVEARLLDELNLRRGLEGLERLAYDPALKQAAALHAVDMSVQNRPWHWGSDGSSPVDRVRRAGYPGHFLGQTISESFEDEITTLDAWMADPTTRAVIMDPAARDLGFAWYQEPATGKLWWVLVAGTTEMAPGPFPTPAVF
jgi:uncharacterized protein YkwD